MEVNDIGTIVKSAREKAKLTQKKLAALAGVSSSLVASVEAGYSKLSIDSAAKIALALKLDMNVLCGISKPNFNTINCDGLTDRQIEAIEIIVDDLRAKNKV